MNRRLFHCGSELFEAFGLSLESAIRYADYCQEPLWFHRHGIRFTAAAFLITDLGAKDGDWTEAHTVRFFPWESVLGILNIKGAVIPQEHTCEQIREWLSTLQRPAVTYPLVHAESRCLAVILIGTPRSVRSKGGKARLKSDVWSLQPTIAEHYGSPKGGPVELTIEVFSTQPDLPDVDRISNSVMDAFVGLAYKDDKQIVHLRPRVFESLSAFARLGCGTEPIPHYELEDIPPGSLFPLAGGIRDYYVVRIRAAGY